MDHCCVHLHSSCKHATAHSVCCKELSEARKKTTEAIEAQVAAANLKRAAEVRIWLGREWIDSCRM